MDPHRIPRQFIFVPFDPLSAMSGIFGAVGETGLDPQPEPDEPPLLIITMVPVIVTPAGLMSMKLPPTCNEISVPASITTVMPALR